MFYRLKDKLSVEEPHLTKAQKISPVHIFPFQMECMYIVRDPINSSNEGCSDAMEGKRISILFQRTFVRFSLRCERTRISNPNSE